MKRMAVYFRALGSWMILGVLVTSKIFAQGGAGAAQGRVLSNETNQYLQGAIVRVVGTQLRADTARDGVFEIKGIAPGEQMLEVSYFGAETKRVPVSVSAGETTRVDVILGSDAVEMQAFKVEADVMGQARAVNQQRVANAMVNITSEEMFGEMTDNNIAKALQRIPGISANSDGGTEIPRYVNIRGFDGSLNSVQLNGVRLPTTGTGQGTVYGDTARAFALDDLPANAITNIEIVKAPTPDMDGDTVGGIVNLITKSAFDREGRSIEVTTGFDYVKLRDKIVPNFALSYSDVAMDGRLGVSVSASYYKGDEGFDNIDYDWRPLLPTAPENQGFGLPGVDQHPVFFHEDTEYNNYFIERDRFGFSASFDYKLNDSTTLFFRPTYSYEERQEDDRRWHKIMDNDHGRAASAPPTGLAVGEYYEGTRGRAIVVETGRGVYSTYESASEVTGRTSLLPNGQGRGVARYSGAMNTLEPELLAVDFGGRHELNWGKANWQIFYSDASKPEERYLARFLRNGLQWAYDRSDIFRPDYRVINGRDPLAVPDQSAPDRFVSVPDFNYQTRETDEQIIQLKADAEVPFFEGTGINGFFKTGAKVRFMEREHNRDFQYFTVINPAAFDFGSYLIASGETVAGFNMPYFPDSERMLNEAMGGNSLFRADTATARRRTQFASDYEASEDSFEGYAMGVIDAGPKLRVITGARVEHTEFEAKTPVYDDANPPQGTRAPSVESRKNDYTEVLPGVHLRYEARNNVVFRAAYTHTYGRPAFRETVAVTTFDEASNTITTGNPDLEPYHSENWDLSVEYYGRKASYFQAALFHKKVDGFVLERSRSVTGVSDIRGIPVDPNETYTVADFENSHTSVNRGIELVGNYKFVYFPSPWDGFYITASATYTDSDGRYADRQGEGLPTYGASEWLFYGTVGYQKHRFSIQLSYRFRDAYLEGLANVDQQFGSNTGVEDDWWGEERMWTLDASYRISRNYRVFAAINNLTEYRNASYQNRPEFKYPEDSYWHEMRIAFGVKATF